MCILLDDILLLDVLSFIEPPGLSRLKFEAPSLWPQRCTKGSYLQLSMAWTSKCLKRDDLGDGGVLCSWVAVEFHFNTSENPRISSSVKFTNFASDSIGYRR